MAKKKEVELIPDDYTEKSGKKAKKAKKEKSNGSKLAQGIGNPVRNLIFTAVVGVLLGLAFFLKPYEVSLYLGYGAGGIMALVGIIYIVLYFIRKPVSGVYRSEFVVGLVALLAGAYVALSGLITSTGGIGYVMIVRIIGILIVADGLLKVQYAVDLGRMSFKSWWVALILAVLSIGVGVLTVTDFSEKTLTAASSAPASMLYTIGGNLGLGSGMGNYADFYGGMKMLGIAFWFNAALDIATLIMIAVRNHKADRAEAIAEASAMIAESKKEELALPEEPELPEGAEEENVVVVPAPAVEAEPAPVPVPAADPALEEPALAAPLDE